MSGGNPPNSMKEFSDDDLVEDKGDGDDEQKIS